jgi:hypothetical protein
LFPQPFLFTCALDALRQENLDTHMSRDQAVSLAIFSAVMRAPNADARITAHS